MAKIESRIVLIDGSVHQTRRSAESHVMKMILSGESIETIDNLALITKSTEMRDYLVKYEERIVRLMQLVRELKEVQDLKI